MRGRGKRAKVESAQEQGHCFGYDLYRLRARKHAQQMEMESDLRGWFSGGEVLFACLSDYMVDLEWLLSAVPSLASIPKVLILHGEDNDAHLRRSIEKHELSQFVLHRPPLPIMFGTHHSKACIVQFATGVRVVVHTANLIYADCGEKTQGAWIQDFPQKTPESHSSEFEQDLLHYFSEVKLPMTKKSELFAAITEHDFSAARVKLIASVPGYHKGEEMKKYGHLHLRECLAREIFASTFKASPIVCQFSSLGSLDEKWLYNEFMASLSAGRVEDDMAELGSPSQDADGLQLVWPTTQQVRNSLEGWAAGRSIPGVSKNVRKSFLRQHWHKFDGSHLGRKRAMPHIKTYARYANNELAWVLLASHNLSKAAWGALQKKGTQLMIRSYELGVLFLPSTERRYQQSPLRNFSCNADPTSAPTLPSTITFVPYNPDSVAVAEDCLAMQFCLPFGLPPVPYSTDDHPWEADVQMPGLDCLGRRWGHGTSMYGYVEPE